VIAWFDQLHARHPASFQGWQMMFILEGLPSVLWAFCWLALAADRPADAGWLTRDEAATVQQALDREQRDVPPVKDYWAAFVVWPSLLLGGVAFLFSYFAGPAHFWPAFAGLVLAGVCMYAPYGPYWAMLPEMVPRNVVGESMALVNSAGALGGFFGTYGVGYL